MEQCEIDETFCSEEKDSEKQSILEKQNNQRTATKDNNDENQSNQTVAREIKETEKRYEPNLFNKGAIRKELGKRAVDVKNKNNVLYPAIDELLHKKIIHNTKEFKRSGYKNVFKKFKIFTTVTEAPIEENDSSLSEISAKIEEAELAQKIQSETLWLNEQHDYFVKRPKDVSVPFSKVFKNLKSKGVVGNLDSRQATSSNAHRWLVWEYGLPMLDLYHLPVLLPGLNLPEKDLEKDANEYLEPLEVHLERVMEREKQDAREALRTARIQPEMEWIISHYYSNDEMQHLTCEAAMKMLVGDDDGEMFISEKPTSSSPRSGGR